MPVRCFTCGAVVADKEEKYNEAVRKGDKPAAILDKFGVKRVCCRRMFISHIDVVESLVKYGKY